MQRFVAILLLVVFAVTVSSFRLEIHYCGGKYESFSIVGKTACEKCDSKKTHKCCKKKKKCCERVIVENEGDENQVKPEFNLTHYSIQTGKITLISDFLFSVENKDPIIADLHDPPPLQVPINILFETFLI